MALQQFHYDEQIRRFLLQFTRIFSNFQVEYGRDDTGAPTYSRIPVRYGDSSKQASVIMADNSANKMPNSPMMTFHITNLDYARDRMQEPNFVDKKTFRQRAWDEGTLLTGLRYLLLNYLEQIGVQEVYQEAMAILILLH